MSAMYANRAVKFKGIDVAKDIEKLSSGEKINRAGDDASGLAVSEKMRAQIRGLNQAEKNVENGISFVQATEAFLTETQDLTQRMRELAVQSANGIYSEEDRMQIQVEVSQLVAEVNRVASQAQFNGMNILTGAFANPSSGGPEIRQMFFQVGANMDQRLRVFIQTMTATALGLQSGQGATAAAMLSISTTDAANRAIGTLDNAMKMITKQRADLGAYQNRFEMAAKGISTASENLQAAESTIRDTDMAAQMVDYVKNSILTQSGNAMLAQANVLPRSVLQLLG
jgi:flagellin